MLVRLSQSGAGPHRDRTRGACSGKLDAYRKAMKRSGVLKGGREKRARILEGLERMEATTRSKGFMTYATALIRADADP